MTSRSETHPSRQEQEAELEVVAERLKAMLIRLAEVHLDAVAAKVGPKTAAYTALEAGRAMLATMLRHVLATDDDQERARSICVAAVATLEEIVLPEGAATRASPRTRTIN